MTLEIHGFDTLAHKLAPEFFAPHVRRFLTRAAIVVQSRARERAPVDTGRLRASIAYLVDDSSPVPLFAQVGSNVEYAPFMEFGTGLLTDGTGGKGGRHWPPGGALVTWAARHGFASGGQVAAFIGRRGGLAPRRYLRGGLGAAQDEIRKLLARLGDEIRAAWDNR